ncbi:MAG: hypothetical protein AB7O73_04345 [Bacteroidia bacterium]
MKSLFTFLSVLFITVNSSAQSEIIGKWKVNCPLEKTEAGTLHVCDICPSVMLANNTAIINDFEWEISAESIKFILDSKELEVAYKYDTKTNTLQFKYNEIDYNFKVLVLSDSFANIFKAKSGEILYLKKLL